MISSVFIVSWWCEDISQAFVSYRLD